MFLRQAGIVIENATSLAARWSVLKKGNVNIFEPIILQKAYLWITSLDIECLAGRGSQLYFLLCAPAFEGTQLDN